jgi:hypothetical protein
MMEQTSTFSGWALIELFGHQKEAGYVTTQYFGDKAIFQVDVPEIAEREEVLTRPEWGDGLYLSAGSVVSRSSIPGRTRLVSPGAIYAINPATEEAVKAAIASSGRREIKVISLADNSNRALVAELPGEDYEDETD